MQASGPRSFLVTVKECELCEGFGGMKYNFSSAITHSMSITASLNAISDYLSSTHYAKIFKI